jgi:hypothetical protein
LTLYAYCVRGGSVIQIPAFITRKDDPDWGETSAEYFFTREEASTAGRAALDRLLKRRTS